MDLPGVEPRAGRPAAARETVQRERRPDVQGFRSARIPAAGAPRARGAEHHRRDPGRCRFRPVPDVRWRSAVAETRRARRRGTSLQSFSHCRASARRLARRCSPAAIPTEPDSATWANFPPALTYRGTQVSCLEAPRRSRKILRQHGYATAMFGKKPQHAGVGSRPRRAVPPLADRLRLRLFLRVPWLGHEPVASRRGGEHAASRARATTGLPPHQRPRPTARSPGHAASSRTIRSSPSSCISQRARRTRRTTRPQTGSQGSRASSIRGGTLIASRRSRAEATRRHTGRHRTHPSPAQHPGVGFMTPERRAIAARQDGRGEEVFAAFGAHTDHEVGRMLAEVRRLPGADNTLVVYLVGDNGPAPRAVNRVHSTKSRRRTAWQVHCSSDPEALSGTGRPALGQQLRDGLGVGDEHAVPVLQADRVPPRRHAEIRWSWPGLAAFRTKGRCGRSSSTSPTSRRRCSRSPGSRRRASSTVSSRCRWTG